MFFTNAPYWWAGAVLLGLAIIIILPKKMTVRKLPLPPGPKGLPLLKNTFDIPKSLEHLTYLNWGKKYGDIVYVTALGKEFIILNSVKAANELLEQRSANYSDRPHLPMLNDEDL